MQRKINQLKGTVKQTARDATDDPLLQGEGAAEEESGRTHEEFGTAKRKVGRAIDDVGDRMKN